MPIQDLTHEQLRDFISEKMTDWDARLTEMDQRMEVMTHLIATKLPENEATWQAFVRQDFAEHIERMNNIESKLDINNLATGSIVETMETWQSAMKTIEYIGKCLRPLTWIIGFGVAMAGAWTTFKTDWKG